MRSPRYTILIANRKNGAVRRLTLSRRAVMAGAAGVLLVPLGLGLAAIGAVRTEMISLRALNATLGLENESYRAATGELAEQISSLQTALDDIGEKADLDPATRKAIDRLPAVVRSRAMGGGTPGAFAGRSTAFPERTLGLLRDLLDVLENRLAVVRTSVESQHALANATPSIWPVAGWLSSAFGARRDPFNGSADFHPGLDISANRGTPVFATAAGRVESASYHGNYGNSILIDHGYGISTRFGHLSGFAVRPGQHIRRGDVIGYVGSTGRATSAHLHYEVLLNGRAVNPMPLLTARP
jgi:murein DD-endopeptidase MepM/ murein hydrolase activator NlpD